MIGQWAGEGGKHTETANLLPGGEEGGPPERKGGPFGNSILFTIPSLGLFCNRVTHVNQNGCQSAMTL